MTDLRVLAESPETTSLPEKVSLLKNLARLEFPRKFVKTLQLGMIPRSVRSVRISKPGTATWPASVPMPSVTALDSGDGFLKFGKSQFPNLTNLTLKIGPRTELLDTILEYGAITELVFCTVSLPEIVSRVSGLPLRYFGIYSGNLPQLRSLASAKQLRKVYLKALPKLTTIEGLDDLPHLESLSIMYCAKIKDIDRVLAIKKLRSLELIGCGKIGVDAIRARLEAKGLERFWTGGTR
jgi:hypothetical protein